MVRKGDVDVGGNEVGSLEVNIDVGELKVVVGERCGRGGFGQERQESLSGSSPVVADLGGRNLPAGLKLLEGSRNNLNSGIDEDDTLNFVECVLGELELDLSVHQSRQALRCRRDGEGTSLIAKTKVLDGSINEKVVRAERFDADDNLRV